MNRRQKKMRRHVERTICGAVVALSSLDAVSGVYGNPATMCGFRSGDQLNRFRSERSL